MYKICLVAHDAAPSRCFAEVQPALTASLSGTHVVKIVGDGERPSISFEELKREVESSHFLLLGMSSSPEWAEIEIAAGTIAREAKIPYGFYSDVSFAVERARKGLWFHSLANDAALVVGIFSLGTIKSIFPNAVAVQTGNPLREQMSFPLCTRKESRARLGIRDDRTLIHVPGGKFCGGNIATLMLLLDALALTLLEYPAVVIFTPHPGDPSLRAVDRETVRALNPYQEIANDAPVEMRIVKKDFMTSSQVVVGADLVVEYTGSTSVEAGYHRIPVISPSFEVWVRKFEHEAHTRVPEMVLCGAALQVYPDVYGLGRVIHSLLKPQSVERMRLIEVQERVCKKAPERGATVVAIVHAIEQVL